jgi:predicted RNase H-like HicB family nuclease
MKLKVIFEADHGRWHVFLPSAANGIFTCAETLEEGRLYIREALMLALEELFTQEEAERLANEAEFEEEIRG